jgi:hypothetical protein
LEYALREVTPTIRFAGQANTIPVEQAHFCVVLGRKKRRAAMRVQEQSNDKRLRAIFQWLAVTE